MTGDKLRDLRFMFMDVLMYVFLCVFLAGEYGRLLGRGQDGGAFGSTSAQTAYIQLPYLCCAHASPLQV